MSLVAPSAHGPTRYLGYMATHDTVMAKLKSMGFIGYDTLEVTRAPAAFTMSGYIACSGRMYVAVEKIMKIVEADETDPVIRTTSYNYAVGVLGTGLVFRYDSPHETHNRDHHRHEYVFGTPDEVSEPRMIGEAGWPTLGGVLFEAQAWYWANVQKHGLAAEDDYPPPGSVRS